MKIVLLGASGQVGWELQRSLAPLAEIISLTRDAPSHQCGDLGRPDALAATVRSIAPDVIVNAAAYTAVDRAETETALAQVTNAFAPGALATVAKDTGAWLVHYSTDYVFPGSGTRAWDEGSATGPLNVYGRTKLEGEDLIRASGCRHLIFRTSWVYSTRGRNFLRTILRLAREQDTINVVNDQFGAPTGAELIADITAHALCAARASPRLGGLYHLSAAGETNWYEYACRVVAFARSSEVLLGPGPRGVVSMPTASFSVVARRPSNSRLDCSRLQETFRVELPAWERGVDRVLTELLERQGQAETAAREKAE